MLSIENVSKKIKVANKEMEILTDVTFEMKRGEMIAICGKSGSGKSSLLSIMSGIDKPTTGKVVFNGEEIYTLSEGKLAQLRNEHFGIIFQNYQLIPELTVLENIEIPILLRKKIEKKNIDMLSILEKVGLQNNAHTKVSLLSGGEQQRVAVARALVQRPSIIFADEPTGALDFENSAIIMELLLMIKREFQIGIFLVTHDSSLAEMADRIIEMDYGKMK